MRHHFHLKPAANINEVITRNSQKPFVTVQDLHEIDVLDFVIIGSYLLNLPWDSATPFPKTQQWLTGCKAPNWVWFHIVLVKKGFSPPKPFVKPVENTFCFFNCLWFFSITKANSLEFVDSVGGLWAGYGCVIGRWIIVMGHCTLLCIGLLDNNGI